MKKLDNYRKQIDKIDDDILDLISKRISIVEKIAKFKIENNIPFLDTKRKMEMISDRSKKAEAKNIPHDIASQLFETIHDLSLKIEKKLK